MKLRVFDFDDTLVKTDAFIHVHNTKTGKKFKLEPEEYAVYTPEEGDEFDFREFHSGPLKNPKVIKQNFDLFVSVLKKSSAERKTVILTARGAAKPILQFLRKKKLPKIDVVALGSSDPLKKSGWIEREIKKGYTDIAFMDDSIKNVKAVNALKKKYPDIKIRAKLVKL